MKTTPHQTQSPFRSFGLAVAALFLATAGTAAAQCTACVNAVTLPAGNVTFSSIDFNEDPFGDPASSGNGYFTLNVTGLAGGSDMSNGPYAAWCGAWHSSVVQTNGTVGYPVLSTYSPSVPAGMKPLVPGNTLNMVNYILNNKVGTVQDVQDAIWLIMVGSTNQLSPASPTAVALANNARTLGAAYVPSAFGKMGVFYVVGPNALAPDAATASNQLQTLMLELDVPLSNSTAPALTCASSSALAGASYSSSLVATGGISPYVFSIAGGALPSGLFLNPSNGAITGVPSIAGSYSYTAQVVDSSGASGTNTASAACTIAVATPAVPSTTCAVITATQGVAITSVTLTGTGGAGGPYTFTATGLPAGLVMSSGGTISGTPTLSGTFPYSVRVADKNGSAATINCSVTVAPPTVSGAVGTGDTATIGFWQNKNGQYMISIANGGGTSTALANWLATQFPALFGATSANNLTGKKNSHVAALFITLFKVTGTKTNAQVMAGALASYITSTTLSGTDATMVSSRTKFRFNSSTGGTGAKTWNVGAYGTAIGLTNNQSYTVLQLLYQANLRKQQGTFDSNAFNVIFDGINVKGDII